MRPDEDWEIDHVEPWRITHRTNIYELQAVHKKCNREKGGKVNFEIKGWDLLRVGQQRAIEGLEARVLNEETTAIVLPCRYGKSDTMRIAALKLWATGKVSTTLVLSPAIGLRDQMGRLWRWNLALKRYGVHVRAPMRIVTIDRPKAGQLCKFNPNGEVFLSATIHLVQQNLDLFTDWVRDEVRRTDRPVLVFIDEGHTASTANEWGKIVPALTEAGAHVCLLTATPERADGYRIQGFRFTEVDQGDVTVWRSKAHENDPDWITIEKLEGKRRLLQLEPDIKEVTFGEAWQEVSPDGKPILCKVSWLTFDPEVKLTDPDGETQTWLSEVKDPRAVRRYLGQAQREPNTIKKAVARLIEDMRERRALDPHFQAVVFGGSDLNQGDERSENRHLEDIRAEIKQQWPRDWDKPKLLIAATADASDGGKDLISDFAGTDEIPGDGDVLLLKQMAGMGTDFPWVKTVLDMSPTRTYAACAQRWLRGATPCAGAAVFGLITTDDVLTQGYFDRLVTQQGGEAKATDLTVTDTYDKKRKPGVDQPLVTVGDVRDGSFADSDGRTAAAELWEKVTELTSWAPKMASVYSHAEMAELLESWPMPEHEPEVGEESTTARDTSADVSVLKKEIVRLHQQIAVPRFLRICTERHIDMTYGRAAEHVFGQAKREAEWPIGVELAQSDKLADLRRLRDAMKAMCVRSWHQENPGQ